MKNLTAYFGLFMAFGVAAAPLQQNVYTVNTTPVVDAHVLSLVGTAYPATNFVLLTQNGNDSTAAINNSSLPAATLSNAVFLLAQSPTTLSNGTVIIPAGNTIIPNTSSQLAVNQGVTVDAFGATVMVTNTVGIFPNVSLFIINTAGNSLTLNGGTYMSSPGGNNTIVYFPSQKCTNATVTLNHLNVLASFDVIVSTANALNVPATNNLNFCYINSMFDIINVSATSTGTNSQFNVNNCTLISDPGGTSGFKARALFANRGFWNINSSTLIGRNSSGVSESVGIEVQNGATLTHINSSFWGYTTNTGVSGVVSNIYDHGPGDVITGFPQNNTNLSVVVGGYDATGQPTTNTQGTSATITFVSTGATNWTIGFTNGVFRSVTHSP